MSQKRDAAHPDCIPMQRMGTRSKDSGNSGEVRTSHLAPRLNQWHIDNFYIPSQRSSGLLASLIVTLFMVWV